MERHIDRFMLGLALIFLLAIFVGLVYGFVYLVVEFGLIWLWILPGIIFIYVVGLVAEQQ